MVIIRILVCIWIMILSVFVGFIWGFNKGRESLRKEIHDLAEKKEGEQ